MDSIRVIYAPDPWNTPVAVAASADTDEAMQAAFDRWAEEALADPLWEHLHPRLRDPEAYAAAREAEARAKAERQSRSFHGMAVWHKQPWTRRADGQPYIGVTYETLPFVSGAPTRGVPAGATAAPEAT